jgi:hypothetical protein
MQIETTLTKSTYVKVNLLLFVRNWGFYFFLLMLVIFTAYAIFVHNFLAPILFIILMVFIFTFTIWFSTSSKNNRNFFTPHKYNFNDNEVEVETPLSKGTMKWESFVKWRKIQIYYLLYVSNNSIFIIPKSSIPDGNFSEFESLLSKHIKRK